MAGERVAQCSVESTDDQVDGFGEQWPETSAVICTVL
jgi:hypothetical protein